MKRWVPAPGSNGRIANGAVLGVALDAEERVEWAYAILPDGSKVVTGYDILPIQPSEPEEL